MCVLSVVLSSVLSGVIYGGCADDGQKDSGVQDLG